MTDIVEEMTELLPCPFCGEHLPKHEGVWQHPFTECFAAGTIIADGLAIAAWNARSTPAIVERRIGELTEALEVARHELRRQHDGVDFDRAKRIRAMMPQIDAALQSKQSVEQRSDQ